MKKCAFTLPEILIVLSIIGVLSMVLIPVAHNSMPDENVIKFKKAHNEIYDIFNELVTNDKWYLNGDLGIKPDGTLLDGTHSGDYTYLCETVASVLNAKSVNCLDDLGYSRWGFENFPDENNSSRVASSESALDANCRIASPTIGNEIITNDGIHYFQVNPHMPFGVSVKNGMQASGDPDNHDGETYRLFNSSENVNTYGYDMEYKTYCIDIDGIPSDATSSDCKNECPFGYGIRADGKIHPGARAKEWMNKDIQNND